VHKYIAVAHRLLGEVAFAKEDLGEAEQHFNTALEKLHEYPAPFVAWKTYAALGRSRLKAGKCERAKEAFAESRRTIEQIASNIDDEPLRSTFLNSHAAQEVFRHNA
jgi:tetratricopeptide (TPR) repeat protein